MTKFGANLSRDLLPSNENRRSSHEIVCNNDINNVTFAQIADKHSNLILSEKT